ncbi:MAG: ECF transporter S component [Oscillospiraceae bacterium]|jgi:uncharacterized membrane protein
MSKRNTDPRTGRMVRLAILVAIIILMAFTPLGYLHAGVVEITFIMIPVVVGAVTLGPAAGALLGGVFGLTSFIQCFGLSHFGAALLAINPIYTFILCMIPRILAGWLPGLIFKALYRVDRTKFLSFAAATLSGALLNTIFFVGFLLIMFGRTDYIMSFGNSAWEIIVLLVGLNGVIEAIVCCVVGAVIGKALAYFIPVRHISPEIQT